MESISQYLSKLIKNQLVSGSLVLFFGSSIASFGNYLYHLLMGRMLGPVDYGFLASIISFTYYLGVLLTAISLVVVKYASSFKGQKNLGAVFYFYSWSLKKAAIFCIILFVMLMVISPWLKSFLHWSSNWPFFWAVVSSLAYVFLTINLSLLQAFLRFGLMSLTGIIQIGIKLLTAVVLVWLGWQVLGAMLAFPISTLVGLIISVFFIRSFLTKNSRSRQLKKKAFTNREIIKYSLPVFFSVLAFTSLYTTDIVLVRHFFPAHQAGLYAALGTLGKILFFASSPVVLVMFPIVSERHSNGKGYANLLGMSFGLVLAICAGISGLYFLLPKLMINLLFGSEYLAASPLLGYFAIFLSFYCLAYLLTNYYLSIKKTKAVALPVVASLIQIGLIVLFHQSLKQVVLVSTGVLVMLLAALVLFDFATIKQSVEVLKILKTNDPKKRS
jgi:O-antigen/teichoic acid export membrane protein